MWQDWVMGVGTIVLWLALLPTLMGPAKPAFSTSLITGGMLFLIALGDWSLNLPLAASFTALSALSWLTLAGQAYHPRVRRVSSLPPPTLYDQERPDSSLPQSCL